MTHAEWLYARQDSYDRLLAEAGDALPQPASPAAFALHNRIVEALDRLPVDQGGRDGVVPTEEINA